MFGSNEKNVENWKVVRRLTAHSSGKMISCLPIIALPWNIDSYFFRLIVTDVAGLSWSDDNRYLASCGFDPNIFIWDGRTFGTTE